jgi:site-specific recombinase XerD
MENVNVFAMVYKHRLNASGEVPVVLCVTLKNKPVLYEPLHKKVKLIDWNAEKRNSKTNKLLNALLEKRKSELLQEFTKSELLGIKLTKQNIRTVSNGGNSKISFTDFVTELVKERTGKFSTSTLNHYNSISTKVTAYENGVKLADIDATWLLSFEKHLRGTGNSDNTLWSDFKACKTVITAAYKKEVINKNPFTNYKMPPYIQQIPEYLTEAEIDKLYKLVFTIEKMGHKLAGMYFLLSCYTGYRISDAKRFNSGMVVNDKVQLRAKKNGSIVSIPVHTKLKPVIDFLKNNPMTLSEQKTREYVKELCSLVGIKKHVKFHTSRHSFAMLLMDKGFTINEVAELIGDTELITKVYARVSNEQLSNKIIERLN